VQHRSSKVYSCFVDFQKDFDFVPQEALFQRPKDIGISETLLTTIVCLYQPFLGHLCTTHKISNFISSTIGVKQGCPLSPRLFRIYTDKLESFLHKYIQDGYECLLHQALISILLFVDDVILFQDISSNMSLKDTLVRPTVL
jgi:hypothetical protein